MDISSKKSQVFLDNLSKTKDVIELPMAEINSILDSDDYLLICDTLEILIPFIESDEIKNLFVDMINCKNSLVRCTACEALQYVCSLDIVILLVNVLKKEKIAMVKMYVLSSLCYIVKVGGISISDFLPELKSMYYSEKANGAIIGYCALFFICDNDIQYLNIILNYLHHKNYHIRCNAINFLYEISDVNSKNTVINAFKQRLQIEKAGAVSSLLEEYLLRWDT